MLEVGSEEEEDIEGKREGFEIRLQLMEEERLRGVED